MTAIDKIRIKLLYRLLIDFLPVRYNGRVLTVTFFYIKA